MRYQNNKNVDGFTIIRTHQSIRQAILKKNLDAIKNIVKMLDPSNTFSSYKNLKVYNAHGEYVKLGDLFNQDSIKNLLHTKLDATNIEESNAHKLFNIVYYDNNYGSITLLHEALLTAQKTEDQDANMYNIVKFILEAGASPLVLNKDGSNIEHGYITQDTNLIKLLFSYGADSRLYDPVNSEQITEIESYQDNPIKYILTKNQDTKLAFQAISNLEIIYNNKIQEYMSLITEPDCKKVTVAGFVYTKCYNKEGFENEITKMGTFLSQSQNVKACLESQPDLIGNLNDLCNNDASLL